MVIQFSGKYWSRISSSKRIGEYSVWCDTPHDSWVRFLIWYVVVIWCQQTVLRTLLTCFTNMKEHLTSTTGQIQGRCLSHRLYTYDFCFWTSALCQLAILMTISYICIYALQIRYVYKYMYILFKLIIVWWSKYSMCRSVSFRPIMWMG